MNIEQNHAIINKKEKEETNMGLDLSALFEGFDIMAIVTALVDMVMGLVGGLLG